MEYVKCVIERRSIRKFKSKPISENILENIIKVASYAPSWKNSQTTRYITVSDQKLKKEIAENYVLGFEYNRKTIFCLLYTSQNPANGEQLDSVPSATEKDILGAIKNARNGKRKWAETPVYERADIFMRFAESMRKNKKELAELLTKETGKRCV